MPVEFNLEEGAYIFKIAASDMAGNVDEEVVLNSFTHFKFHINYNRNILL